VGSAVFRLVPTREGDGHAGIKITKLTESDGYSGYRTKFRARGRERRTREGSPAEGVTV